MVDIITRLNDPEMYIDAVDDAAKAIAAQQEIIDGWVEHDILCEKTLKSPNNQDVTCTCGLTDALAGLQNIMGIRGEEKKQVGLYDIRPFDGAGLYETRPFDKD